MNMTYQSEPDYKTIKDPTPTLAGCSAKVVYTTRSHVPSRHMHM